MIPEDLWAELGFTPGEGKVYSAIMNLENATLQRIHEHAGLERRSVYDIVNKLVNRGLVVYFTENKHKIYRLTDPKNMLASYEEEEAEIGKKRNALMKHLPMLRKAYLSTKPEFDVRIYRGRDGMKTLFNEMLDYPDHYFIGGNWGLIKYVGERWWELWNSKRVAKKIHWHDLVVSKPKLMAQYNLPSKYYEHKVLPPEFGSPNVIAIFGNRVANIYWSDTLSVFEIQNKEIAENHLNYFRHLWKTVK